MATVEQAKARLGIRDAETSFDEVLEEILKAVSAEIERAARRRLRRAHRVTEYATGGTRLIALRYYPIANIESVRESETRDFDDEDNYTALIEGTDYVFEPGNGINGHSGIIRRLNQDWLGDESDPGKVQVIYSGGYKTTEEASIENGTVNVSQVERILDFGVFQESQSGFDAEDETEILTSDIQRAVVRFNTDGLLLPTWTIIRATLSLSARLQTALSDGAVLRAYVLGDTDPIASMPGVTFAAIASEGQLFNETDDAGIVSETFAAFEMGIQSDSYNDVTENLRKSTTRGFAAFGMIMLPTEQPYFIASRENATGSLRPSLSIRHQPAFFDAFSMPDDLRSACLLQASHVFQQRRTPGRTESSMRGVSIASGSFEKHDSMQLLPSVQRIAESYRRYH